MNDAATDEVEVAAVHDHNDELDAFPQHEECVAILTMKCGEPLMAVRKKLHDEIPVTFIPEEGFAVFQSKIERHFGKIGPNYVQEKRAIYLKPSSNATQSKYVLLTKENFDPLLRVRWKVARSMKVDLKYEVFCYFVDTTVRKEKKRLSMKMFQPEDPNGLDMGNGNLPHFATSNGPQGFPIVSAQTISQTIQNYADIGASINESSLPVAGKRGKNTNGKDSSGGVAAGSAVAAVGADALDHTRPRKIARGGRTAPSFLSPATTEMLDATEEPLFCAIPFRINGFVVPLEVDVAALRRALGLVPQPANADVSGSPASSGNMEAPQYDR